MMNRRNFVAKAGTTLAAPTIAATALSSSSMVDPQYFELRHYRYPNRLATHRDRLTHYLEQAAIPAWNRHGLSHVGVFSVMYGPNAPSLYVLLCHPTLESVTTLRSRLAEDETHQREGSDFLNATLSQPAFVRVESTLMKAFSGMPSVEVPQSTQQNQPRIFELRIYESHSDAAAIRKIEMFNNGEIDIFLKTGLTPVFFGESLVGNQLPNLTYMLTFKDMNDRDASWNTFVNHPDWKAMSSDPYYADTVSNITSIILRPLSFSQI